MNIHLAYDIQNLPFNCFVLFCFVCSCLVFVSLEANWSTGQENIVLVLFLFSYFIEKLFTALRRVSTINKCLFIFYKLFLYLS